MAEKKCPLCGKPVEEENAFCGDCSETVRQRESLDLLSEDDVPVSEEFTALEEDDEGFPLGPKDEALANNTQQKKTSNTKWYVMLGIGIILILALGGYSYYLNTQLRASEEAEINNWYESVRENTPFAYSKYLLMYPQGKFSAEAQEKITELRKQEQQEWERLKMSSDIDSFYTYLSTYPETPFKHDIQVIVDSLSWEKAQKDNTAHAYQAYLDNIGLGNITGYYRSLAQERYDYLSQLKEIEGDELKEVKNRITGFYNTLAKGEYKSLNAYIADTVSDYYGAKGVLLSKITSDIDADIKKRNVKNFVFQPVVDTVTVIKDNKDIYRLHAVVKKRTVYKNKKKKDDNSSERLYIELNGKKQITSVYPRK